MARPANPLTPVTKQLQVIQAKYKKLGMLIDKLTNEVNGSMKKGKAQIEEEEKGVKEIIKKNTGSRVIKVAGKVKGTNNIEAKAENKKKITKKTNSSRKK